jgi:hypothetical protein
MPAKTPSKGKKAAPKAKKSAPAKTAKKASPPAPPVVEPEETLADEPDEDEDDEFDLEADEDEEEAPRPAVAAAAKPVVKKPAAPAPAARARGGAAQGEDAPAVVPARRLTPEAKARVNEMVRKGMSLGDALKVAASWETFVAPVKDEPAKLVQGRMGGGGGGGGAGAGDGPRSNFAGETDPEDLHEGGDDEEPAASDED